MVLASLVAGRIMRQTVRCQSRQKYSVNWRPFFILQRTVVGFKCSIRMWLCGCACTCVLAWVRWERRGKGRKRSFPGGKACGKDVCGFSLPAVCGPNLNLVDFAWNTKVKHLRKLNCFRSWDLSFEYGISLCVLLLVVGKIIFYTPIPHTHTHRATYAWKINGFTPLYCMLAVENIFRTRVFKNVGKLFSLNFPLSPAPLSFLILTLTLGSPVKS